MSFKVCPYCKSASIIYSAMHDYLNTPPYTCINCNAQFYIPINTEFFKLYQVSLDTRLASTTRKEK